MLHMDQPVFPSCVLSLQVGAAQEALFAGQWLSCTEESAANVWPPQIAMRGLVSEKAMAGPTVLRESLSPGGGFTVPAAAGPAITQASVFWPPALSCNFSRSQKDS